MTPNLHDQAPDTRQRLLEAAVLAFAQKGFDGTGIREIAQNAQANSALVQYYFGSKEGLYLAALRFLFEQGPNAVRALAPPPEPGTLDALPKAHGAFRTYIKAFLEELFSCHDGGPCSREMHGAIHLFWTRELMDPTPERSALLLEHIQPYVDYLDACLKVLRPDLDPETRFLMGCSIHAQVMFFHRELAVIALIRGEAYGPKDVDRLAEHITSFSLRGLEAAVPGA